MECLTVVSLMMEAVPVVAWVRALYRVEWWKRTALGRLSVLLTD